MAAHDASHALAAARSIGEIASGGLAGGRWRTDAQRARVIAGRPGVASGVAGLSAVANAAHAGLRGGLASEVAPPVDEDASSARDDATDTTSVSLATALGRLVAAAPTLLIALGRGR
jgi:hypothetical protein